MKRSVHPLFTILPVAAIAFTVTFGFATLRSERNVFPVEAQALPVVFNSTLLKFAAIDVGEASLRQEIEQLLEGNFRSRARHRSISSWRRFRPYPQNPRTSNGVPIDFRSPKFYRLWLQFRMVLQGWARNRRHQPEIMSDLARLVKYPIDGSVPRYSSCAVVGNSGVLLHKDYGELIDSHEVVVRLNNARVKNYQRHVGSKTNVSFVNSNILHLCARREGCFCHPYGVGVPIVMYICQPAHFLDYIVCNSSHRGPLLITDPRFDLLCARIVKYYSAKRFVEDLGRPLEKWSSTHEGTIFHYSSGMQAVMLALGICNRVSIFGFGKSALAKHHYHTNQKQELHLHDYEAEYAFYHDLVVQPQVVPFISNKFRFPPVSLYQ